MGAGGLILAGASISNALIDSAVLFALPSAILLRYTLRHLPALQVKGFWQYVAPALPLLNLYVVYRIVLTNRGQQSVGETIVEESQTKDEWEAGFR